MRRKVLVTLLCLAFSVCVIACGKEAEEEQNTENTVVVQETEEVTDTQEQSTEDIATESVETTEVQESETEVIQTETEEMVEATETEVIAETETPQSLELTYEDFACEYQGYTNYIDFEQNTPEKHEIQIVYEQPADETYYLPAENDTPKRGLKLGDSRERVLELYGDYDKRVVYRNMRLKYNDLVPEENYIYYLQGYEPTTVDGLYCMIITLDKDGNVLAILYGWAESKYM